MTMSLKHYLLLIFSAFDTWKKIAIINLNDLARSIFGHTTYFVLFYDQTI